MIPGRFDFTVFCGDSERLVVFLVEPVSGTADMTPVILAGRELRWQIDIPSRPPLIMTSADGSIKSIDPYGCFWIDLGPAVTSLFYSNIHSKYKISIIDQDKFETWLAGNIMARSI